MFDLEQIILERHSTRLFLPKPVPRELVEEALALAVHAGNSGQGRAEELPVAQDGSVMAGLVLTGNSHRPVDFSAQFLAKVPEQLGKRRDVGWPTVRLLE